MYTLSSHDIMKKVRNREKYFQARNHQTPIGSGPILSIAYHKSGDLGTKTCGAVTIRLVYSPNDQPDKSYTKPWFTHVVTNVTKNPHYMELHTGLILSVQTFQLENMLNSTCIREINYYVSVCTCSGNITCQDSITLIPVAFMQYVSLSTNGMAIAIRIRRRSTATTSSIITNKTQSLGIWEWLH